MARIDTTRWNTGRCKPLSRFLQCAALGNANGGTVYLGARLVAVAAVRKEPCAYRLGADKHNQRCIRTGEAAKVAHVRQVRYEQGG